MNSEHSQIRVPKLGQEHKYQRAARNQVTAHGAILGCLLCMPEWPPEAPQTQLYQEI